MVAALYYVIMKCVFRFGADMTNQEIVMHGRQRMDETDAELQRGKKIVTETEEVAVKTAAQLKNQTDQMGRIVDDLNEIEFSMQRATKVIRDITRGLATDKYASNQHDQAACATAACWAYTC